MFNVGQYPTKPTIGNSYQVMQALTYVPKGSAPRRVVFLIRLHVTDAEGAYNQTRNNAQSFLDNDLYANVTGTERNNLTTALAQTPTATTYASQTTAINNALLAFVKAKVDFDTFSAAQTLALTATTDYPYAQTDKITALESMGRQTPSTVSEARTMASQLTEALKTVVLSNADAEKVGATTNYLLNPEFASGSTTHWDITSFVAGFKDIVNSENYDDALNPYFLNYGSWGQGVYSFDVKLSQTIAQLPRGTYLLSLMSRGQDLNEFTLNFKTALADTTATLNFSGNTGQMFTDGWNNQYFVFDNPTDGQAVVTVVASASKDQTFASVGRFRLIRLSDQPTAIRIVRSNPSHLTIYNLNGQVVGRSTEALQQLCRGIYIINGQKIVKLNQDHK